MVGTAGGPCSGRPHDGCSHRPAGHRGLWPGNPLRLSLRVGDGTVAGDPAGSDRRPVHWCNRPSAHGPGATTTPARLAAAGAWSSLAGPLGQAQAATLAPGRNHIDRCDIRPGGYSVDGWGRLRRSQCSFEPGTALSVRGQCPGAAPSSGLCDSGSKGTAAFAEADGWFGKQVAKPKRSRHHASWRDISFSAGCHRHGPTRRNPSGTISQTAFSSLTGFCLESADITFAGILHSGRYGSRRGGRISRHRAGRGYCCTLSGATSRAGPAAGDVAAASAPSDALHPADSSAAEPPGFRLGSGAWQRVSGPQPGSRPLPHPEPAQCRIRAEPEGWTTHRSLSWITVRPGPSLSLSEGVEEYLTYLAVDRARSPQTIRAYSTDLASALEFWNGLKRPPHAVSELSRDLVRAYQRHLGGSGLALSSRARRLQALRGLLRYAMRESWLEEDLGLHIDIPRVSAPLPKPLTTDDARTLLDHRSEGSERELRDQALVHFLLSTGCRISEALGVNRSDLSHSGRLVVRGKGSKERMVHLTPAALSAISTYLQARHDREPALFLNYDRRSQAAGARRLTAAGARHIISRLRRERGLEALRSPHVLRHTTATELLTITGNVRLVQEVLGHANLNTMQGYTKVVDQARTEAYREFSRRLATRSGVKESALGSEPGERT